MGIVSHVLITNMRRPMLSHRVMIDCMGAIAILSYMVYGHHMFVSGMNPFSSLAFSFPTLIITIPATIIVLMWIGSLYGSRLRINTASLFALGFISMFVTGGVSGFFLAQPSIDIMLHATYFVVGHFHMVMAVAAMFGIFAGTYFWFPKMTGRMMNETLGKIHFWLSFVGAYCIFMPFHYLGIAGNVRRYQAFVDDYLQPLIPVHRFITVAAIVTGVAQFIFLYNLIHSRFWGKPAPDNPWEATSLEWSTPTPPPFDNFGGKHPVVYHDPYQYGVQSSTGDYVMQTSPGAGCERSTTRSKRARIWKFNGEFGRLWRPRSTNHRRSSRAVNATTVTAAGEILFLRMATGASCRTTLRHRRAPASGWWCMPSCMTFAAFTSALMVRKGSSLDWQSFTLPSILYLNTALILCSSVTLEIARRRIATFMGGVTVPVRVRHAGSTSLWSSACSL